MSRRKTVICSSSPPIVIYKPIRVCSTCLDSLTKKRNFVFSSSSAPPLIFYFDVFVCVCFVFSPSTHKHISLYSYWVCCDFLCRLESIKKGEPIGYHYAILFFVFSLHFSSCVYTIVLVKLFCSCALFTKTCRLFIICPVELYVCVCVCGLLLFVLSGSCFDSYT
jgi:hypothetical protein